jgi:gluconolactonase
MFAAPPEITADVFAKIPSNFCNPRPDSVWAIGQRPGRSTPCFLEGPVFDNGANLYMVDVAFGRIFRIDPNAQVELFLEYDGEPNGLKFHPDGRLIVADFKHGLMAIDIASRRISPLLVRHGLERFKGVNDLCFAKNGDLFFTDQGMTGLHDPSGSVYRLRTNGQLEHVLGGIPSPNGLVYDDEASTLLVNVTRANAVWRVPLDSFGRPYKVGTFIQLSGSLGGPDGLAMDELGGLAVAHVGMGSVWLFNRLGEPTLRVRVPEGLATTNIAYGGADRRTLYITEGDTSTVYLAKVPVAGREVGSPRAK